MPPLVTSYDELKLRIGRDASGGHRVLATGPVGEASTAFVLPFSDVELENFVLRVGRPRTTRRGDTSSMRAAEEFGARLFDAVFADDVRDLYRTALARSRAAGRGLRVTLALSGAPELMDVPWEYLYDDPSFLAVSAFTPVVRYLDLPRAYRPLEIAPPMRVLAMVSSPNDYQPLDVDKERANLEQALSGLIAAGAVEVEWLERPTLGSLLRALQSQAFHALHYVGHGAYDEASQQGLLMFQDEGGWAKPVSGDKLGTILQDFTSLRLAVLNACEGARTSRTDPFAGVAASLVERDIPAVIAMQFEITDVSAVTFAEGFYRSLASGSPVDAALAAARLAIFAERSDDIEWGTPVLFMRVGDGQVFDVPEPVVQPPKAIVAPPPAEPAAAVPPAPARVPGPEPEQQSAPAVIRGRGAPAPPAALPRRGLLIGGVLAAVLALGAIVLIASGGGGGGTPPANPAPAPPPSPSPTPAGGSSVLAVDRTGTAGPLTLTVTKIERTSAGIVIHMTGRSGAKVTLPGYMDLTASNENGDAYQLSPDSYDPWTVVPGTPLNHQAAFEGDVGGKSVTIGYSTLYWGEPRGYPETISVSDIPLPAKPR